MTDHMSRPRTLTIAGGLALTAFVVLALIAGHAHTGTIVDHHVLDWLVAHRHSWLTTPAVIITDVGGPAGVAAFAVIAGCVLWWRTRSVVSAAVLIGTVGLAALVSSVTKVAAGTSRPPAATQLLTETDHSFPSGHVTGTLTLCGILAVIAIRAHPRAAMPAVGAAAAVTAVVAATRLYLGVHWLIDVLGGMLLGSAFTLFGTAALASASTPMTPADKPQPTLTG